MKTKYLLIIIIATIIVVAASVTFAITQNNKYQTLNSQYSYYTNSMASPYIPDSYTFADEPVPLDVYWVREALDRELMICCYQHSKTLRIIKSAGRFFPIIEPILKEEGVPDDFKYLCVAESGLDNVVSSAKAAGFWQFIKPTALNYGLEVNDEVDERYLLEKSTRAACRYLKNAKQSLGSWTLAAAAYNMGENGVNNSMSKQQCDDYWDLHLNSETARYVYRILSYKLVMQNPRIYGINVCSADLYQPIPTKEVVIANKTINLYDFAKEQNISYKELKLLNPWLRDSKLTATNKSYTIKVPEKAKSHFADLIKNIDNPFLLLGDTIFNEREVFVY